MSNLPAHISEVDVRAFSKSVHRVLAKHPRVKDGVSDLYVAEWRERRGHWTLEMPFKTGRSFDDAYDGDPGKEIMRGMECVGRKYGLVFIDWEPMEKGWGDFMWELKPGKKSSARKGAHRYLTKAWLAKLD